MLQSRLAGIDRRVKTELEAQGFKPDQIKTEKVLHMRFDGSDTSLMMYVGLAILLVSVHILMNAVPNPQIVTSNLLSRSHTRLNSVSSSPAKS